ncbi:NAD-dependent epimerase/dehydratase family protein [Streptomyces johnsoniae]|uniref:NAD-dependent epimerase/dehydratase family protein n=1 Tax=Streptomyces johnsoniae TaxID=3075532 RepID=A0ABU2S131_9ACTN|nr:NAD-dependent epimerase/dehydratase family protein [Streptomyces sp. DSM 41886]MDT0442488.1 NAD-dependent epimerase/dehydratase family protein [Streptomyces sp. DSM 41886]
MNTASARIVVTGATGNIGTGVVRRLAADPRVGSVVGIARRRPETSPDGVTWIGADITEEPGLDRLFAGADAVIHLACLFQPAHRPEVTWRTNVLGSDRVFAAVARAGVPALIHASSVVAYAPGPKDRRVDESWPTDGWPTAPYCREKAYTERLLDVFEYENPGVRVVRLRPGIVVAADSAPQQRRLFAGPFLPARRPPRPLRVLPGLAGLTFQALHSDDAADAFCRAALQQVRGPFNIAAEPPVDPRLLARLTGARLLPVPYRPLRAAVDAAWHLRLVPTSAAMLDAVLTFPLMDTGRARRELGWDPRHSAADATARFLSGLRGSGGGDTPPLRRRLPGGGRLREAARGPGESQ